MTGVVSADFPGEASRYVEEMFDNKTVAVFTQGAEGDQNPRLAYSPPFRFRQTQGQLANDMPQPVQLLLAFDMALGAAIEAYFALVWSSTRKGPPAHYDARDGERGKNQSLVFP